MSNWVILVPLAVILALILGQLTYKYNWKIKEWF